jgi:hypothetical protein
MRHSVHFQWEIFISETFLKFVSVVRFLLHLFPCSLRYSSELLRTIGPRLDICWHHIRWSESKIFTISILFFKKLLLGLINIICFQASYCILSKNSVYSVFVHTSVLYTLYVLYTIADCIQKYFNLGWKVHFYLYHG